MRLNQKMRAFMLIIACSMSVTMFAQKVKGVVLDTHGEPLIGATVKVEGTNDGTVTDLNGNFVVNAGATAKLTVSYVGFTAQSVNVNGKDNLKIVLAEEKHNLNQVVVIGYGTQRREAVTGSVANVSGDELNAVAATNVAAALAGRVPGVVMTQTSSQPGDEMQIRIRGQRSLNASNDPLIVLDGVPFMGNLSDIPTADIKSIDILKDASATAIYGSRGANGVIMITTLNGVQSSPAKVSYNMYAGWKNEFNKYPMMNGPQFVALREYLKDHATGTSYTVNGPDEDNSVDTDWQDMFFRTGYTQSHNLSVQGGTDGGHYSFGAGYYNDAAVVPGQDFSRYSVRGNIDQKVGNYFRFGLSTNTNYSVRNGGQIGLYGVLSATPIANPYNEDGTLKRTIKMNADENYILTPDIIDSLDNVWMNERKGFGSYNTLFAEVMCPWIEGLSYRINVGLNYRNNKTGSFTGTGVNNVTPTAINSASIDESIRKNWSVENVLTYDHTFADVHHFNIVGMYSAENTRFEQTGMSGQDIPNEAFQYFNIGYAQQNITVSPNGQRFWESGLQSIMGRVMYDFDNKYMLSATVRSDGSSRLASGHKWHTYPAVSAGWNINREKFMSDIDWLDRLKVRVGYGETSNQSIDPYSTLGSLSTNFYNFGPTGYSTGYYVSALPNTELGWEYTKTWNFGLDFTLFGGRLRGTFEYYIQNTHDLLLAVSLPSTAGVSSSMQNIGKTRNKGWEFGINGTILENHNGWTWNAGINFYSNHNELVELASGAERDEGNRWFVGHPIDCIYDYNKIGIWQSDEEDLRNKLEPGGNAGMIKVEYTGNYDEKGDPTRPIGPEDRQIISMEPDLMGGFNTDVSYKNFDLSVIGAFQIGGKLISAIHSSNGYLNMLTGRRGQLDVDYWTEDNPTNKYPKPGGIVDGDNPKYASTLGYFDAGYLKIRTITLGYSFQNLAAIKKLGIERLRVYATVQNPFVFFSPYKNECGLDPETNTFAHNGATTAVTFSGYTGAHKLPIVGYNTPATRNFLFGINLTF
ncbi:MAG: TonB-dependent receptor [Bacteroidaceae bacterium]|nr:TonB-dependent receptor [Bacteroidaceae bacterium]